MPMRVERLENRKLSGAAVKGTVLEASLCENRLALDTDGERERRDSWHIQPVYYAGGGKGYSGQPEKGDTQYLYFPTMREEDRYIIGCADAGTEEIKTLMEATERESAGDEPEDSLPSDMHSSIAAAGIAVAEVIPTATGGAQLYRGGSTAAAQETMPATKNWSTPGSRRLVLGESGIKLANAGNSRAAVLESSIRIWSKGKLELETGKLGGKGREITANAKDYVWIHSGDSGILLAPDGIHVRSVELELKSPKNEPRNHYDADAVQSVLEKYRQAKIMMLPYAASDGSIITRQGYNEILFSEETYQYFMDNVYGTEGYENEMQQPPDLIYRCWLDDVYGRSDLGKFWDHMETLDGLQDMLSVIGIFFEPADMLNAVIYFCRGMPVEGCASLLSCLPLIGDMLFKGGKWISSVGADLFLKSTKYEYELIDILSLSYKVSSKELKYLEKYLDDVVDLIPTNGSAKLVMGGEEILSSNSRIIIEITDDAGNISRYVKQLDSLDGWTKLDDWRKLDDFGTGSLDDTLKGVKRIDKIEVEFNYDPKYNEKEFVRQWLIKKKE